jgi:Na+/H+ antiporter NhaD/arsenite permease-like protein
MLSELLLASAHAVSGPASPSHYWLAAAIFAGVYVLIISEKIEKTKAALIGAALVLGIGIVSQQEAFFSEHLGIDYNVIFLLISMMIIVNVMGRSGVFEWAAIRIAKLAGGRPPLIIAFFVLATALASALLDNVTTVLLVAPVTLMIADKLEIDPVPILVLEALASNIGGTATLIGDPPNIMIGSKVGIGFSAFITELGPIVAIMLAAMVGAVHLLYGKKLRVTEEKRREILDIDENTLIRDHSLMRKSLVIVSMTIAGFMLHGVTHIEPATIALCGAIAMMVVSGFDAHKILHEVEWTSIFFFIGLFIVVGGVVKVNLIEDLSRVVIELTGPTKDDMFITSMVMLWFSGIASGIIDNIPYVATMIPLISDMGVAVLGTGAAGEDHAELLHHATLMPVWWSLALGACLGGNMTPIGASANVVVLGIAKKAGHHVSFLRFTAVGAPVTFLTLAASTVYVYLRYY